MLATTLRQLWEEILREPFEGDRVPSDASANALRFAWTHHSRGIAARIDRGTVKVLAFANPEYRNDWELPAHFHVGHYYDRKRRTLRMRREHVIQDTRRWWCNGRIVCNELPPKHKPIWSLRNVPELTEMLEAAAALDPTLQGVFLLNKRDFPMMLEDPAVDPLLWARGADWPLCDGAAPRLRRCQFREMTPCLSYYVGPGWRDLPMPLPEDWAAEPPAADPPNLASLEPRAVFRGSLTGPLEGNQRLGIVRLGERHPELLDAAMTRGSERDRFHPVDGLRFASGVVPGRSMTRAEQCRFRGLVYADGHVAASRLGWMLGSGCVVLRVLPERRNPAPEMWYTPMLRGDEHTLDVLPDLSDLRTRLGELQDDLPRMREIAAASVDFHRRHFTRASMARALLESLRMASAAPVDRSRGPFHMDNWHFFTCGAV